MPVRRFLGYFVALAACATAAFGSFGGDDLDTPSGSAAASPYSALSYPAPAYPGLPLPASAFRVHPRKVSLKHVQVAQAE